MTLISVIPRVAAGALGCALLSLSGCKPAAAPTTEQASPPPDASPQSQKSSTPSQPTANDFANYFRPTMKPFVKLVEVKADPPMRMPNAPPGSNVWLLNLKLTLAATEDLFGICPEEVDDTKAIASLTNELNGLVAWSNAYAQSAYARVYPGFEAKTPVSPVPLLIVLQQAKDRPQAPVYGKVAAEWQVDHWNFYAVDLDIPKVGNPRSAFNGPTMVQGSPETADFFKIERDAIAQAKGKKDAIESRYADDLAKATKPGTTYRGQISHPRGILPCEVRFLNTPGVDPQMAMFEVRLPQEPSYQLVYTAKLALQVPLNMPADAAANQYFPTPVPVGNPLPVGNLTVNFVRCAGKATPFGSLPSVLLYGGKVMGGNKPFLLLNRRIQGVVAQFNDNFSLNAEQIP